MGKTVAGKSYTNSGSSGCLTDLLGLEAAMVEYIVREEVTINELEFLRGAMNCKMTQAEDWRFLRLSRIVGVVFCTILG